MIQGIVFDLDGVLVDTSRVWHRVQNDVAARLGLPPVPWERFLPTFGEGTAADVEHFFPGATVPQVDALYHERFLARIGEVERLRGADRLLDALEERGIGRGVATNTMYPLAEALLEATGLAERIDTLASASEVAQAKPAPDVLLLAVSRLDVEPRQALFVGDAAVDELSARAAGILFCGFRRDGDLRIERLEELLLKI